MSYFDLAVALTRAEAAPTLAKLATKHQAIRRIARKPIHDFESVVYVTDADGQEWEIEVGICYDASYTAGKFSGPWEDSYPADSEMDIHDVITDINDLPAGITAAMVMDAAEADRDRIESEAWNHYEAQRERDE